MNTAVKLINGYMNYLKQAGKKSSVREDPGEYLTTDQNDTDNFPIGDN